MRLYSRFGASHVINDDHGEFEVDPESGAVEVPPEMGAVLRAQHINGARAWEDDAERHARLAAEEAERRKDPATLLAAVEALAAKVAEPAEAPAKSAPAKKAAPKKAAAAKAE